MVQEWKSAYLRVLANQNITVNFPVRCYIHEFYYQLENTTNVICDLRVLFNNSLGNTLDWVTGSSFALNFNLFRITAAGPNLFRVKVNSSQYSVNIVTGATYIWNLHFLYSENAYPISETRAPSKKPIR